MEFREDVIEEEASEGGGAADEGTEVNSLHVNCFSLRDYCWN